MLSYVNKFNHHCIESVVKMLPFETPTIFEQLPRFIFKMPRVVSDQKAKFESDELFRRLSRESEVNNQVLIFNIINMRKIFIIDQFNDFSMCFFCKFHLFIIALMNN